MSFLTKKHSLIFAGGLATGIAAKTILKSDTVRNLTVKAVASGMKFQQDAAYQFETIREDAQDLVEEEYRTQAEKEETVLEEDEI